MNNTFLQVALGGAIGSVARHGVNLLALRAQPGLPLGTVFVNVTGSFVMGLVAAWVSVRGGQHLTPFLMTGVLGGFTTFSAFSLDTIALWERGQQGLAIGYVLGSVLLSLVAMTAGLLIGRAVLA